MEKNNWISSDLVHHISMTPPDFKPISRECINCGMTLTTSNPFITVICECGKDQIGITIK